MGRVPKPEGTEPGDHSSAEPPEAEAGHPGHCDSAPTGHAKVVKRFYCGANGFVSTSRPCENQVPTFLRQVQKAREAFWPKKQKLWFQDHAVFPWSVQKSAS